MGDQVHSYTFVVHQCGDGECQMDLTTNMDAAGVVSMAVEVLEQHAGQVEGLQVIDDGTSGSSEKEEKPKFH